MYYFITILLRKSKFDFDVVIVCKQSNVKYTKQDSQLDLLCHYLETGELPWWSSNNGWGLEQQIQHFLKSKRN